MSRQSAFVKNSLRSVWWRSGLGYSSCEMKPLRMIETGWPGRGSRREPLLLLLLLALALFNVTGVFAEETHWSYRLPVRPVVPSVRQADWPRNPIDHFVLRRLESQRLVPSPRADRFTRLRRLSLDLCGLPPGLAQIAAFQADRRPGAWSRAVSRLLASPRYGERMATPWLDAARYADTAGHAADQPRTMWLFRDWVIAAFNRNQPFDEFTIEQLAGDMLPNPTRNQLIATGFHRNSIQALGNNPRKEEFRIKGVVDRVETTGRVWLGLTVACAECHDHKYEDFSQTEYYRFFAIFNNVPHLGEKFAVHGPRIQVIPTATRSVIDQLQRELVALEKQAVSTDQSGDQRILEDLRAWSRRPRELVALQSPLLGVHFDGTVTTRNAQGSPVPLSTRSSHLGQAAFVVDGPRPGIPAVTLGRGQSIVFDRTSVSSITGDLAIGLWVRTTQSVADLVSQYDWRSGRRSHVFGIGGEADKDSRPGRLFTWLSQTASPFDGAVVYGSIPVNDGHWHHVAMSYTAGGSVSLFVDGQRDTEARLTGRVPQRLAAATLPLVLGGGFNKSGRPNDYFVRGQMADVRIFDRPLDGVQLGGLSTATSRELDTFIRSGTQEIPSRLRSLHARLSASLPGADGRKRVLMNQLKRLKQATVTAQVMQELPQPRTTFVHRRGDFENPGEKVEPSIPRLLSHRGGPVAPATRLTLARTLVDGTHPLVPRVAVNRLWQHHFGVGLVSTPDDFGVSGEPPSHPKLLDWLATELVDSGWDIKHIQRLILGSATYQQESRILAVARSMDPENRWLGRFPRRRLDAEQIRDLALLASGRLVERIGGPSVYPPQPASIGQFRDKTAGTWKASRGVGRYRRSLYTFWQRMSPYPSLVLFDAPSRERCLVARTSTNTPLQALVLLNDPHFVDLAHGLAARMLAVEGAVDDRIRLGFLVTLSRPPDPDELAAFRREIGDSDDPDAWFRLAQVLLNLDETITRE